MSNNKTTFYSVLEYVELMGYSKPPSPSMLGKQIAKAYREAWLEEPHTECRIINGRQTHVKVYDYPTDAVDAAIKKYYEAFPDL